MDTPPTQSYISPVICKSLLNQKVVNFIQSVIKKSYQEFYSDHLAEINSMVEDTFKLLTESQRREYGLNSLIDSVKEIHNTIFIKKEDSWFYQRYQHYKVDIRPKADFKKIGHLIQGKTVLDVGAGACYFASELQRHGYDVTAIDVLDYRNGSTKDVKFIKMNNPTEVPVETVYDTAFLKTVLHHISHDDIPVLLQNLRKKSKRLILEEDVFGLECKDTSELVITQPDLDYFCSLTETDQQDFLNLMDFFGNIIVYGIDDMNLPFQFKTLRDWEELLTKVGWKLTQKMIVGFDSTRIHRPCQVWFICD